MWAPVSHTGSEEKCRSPVLEAMDLMSSSSRTVPRSWFREYFRKSRAQPWFWFWPLAILLVVGSALALVIQGASGPSGRLVPDHTFHDFGRVRMGDGLLVARFPLTVQGPTRVTGVATT